MIEKLFGQTADGFSVLGQDHQPACVFVDAVHQAAAGQGLFADLVVLLKKIPGDPVDERAGVVPAGGVDDETGGFVDDHHVLIFIMDIEGDLSGRSFAVRLPYPSSRMISSSGRIL